MKDFLRLLKDHPKTSAGGIALIASAVIAAIHNPSILSDPSTWAKVIAGLSLIGAADAK